MRKTYIIVLLAVCAGVVGCGSEHPEIGIDANVRVMYDQNGLISGEQDQENRCMANGVCTGSLICWNPTSDTRFDFIYGYCRECDSDHLTCGGLTCDHGWCHSTCATSNDCDTEHTGTYCTDGYCRKPDTAALQICNEGSGKLEIYPERTKLYGNTDACAFYRLEWANTGPITLSKGECTYLRINYSPTDETVSRAYVSIYSNDPDPKHNPLPLLLCGRGAEAPCYVENKTNGLCMDETLQCTLENFTAEQLATTPDCSAVIK